MAVPVELLAQMIGALPTSEDTQAALRFLRRSDLIKIAPSGKEVSYGTADESLRIFRIKQETTTKAGMITYGFPSLLSALGKLHPTDLVTGMAFDTADWFGSFVLDKADQLVGFVLVKRRSPEEEQERLEWFQRNLT